MYFACTVHSRAFHWLNKTIKSNMNGSMTLSLIIYQHARNIECVFTINNWILIQNVLTGNERMFPIPVRFRITSWVMRLQMSVWLKKWWIYLSSISHALFRFQTHWTVNFNLSEFPGHLLTIDLVRLKNKHMRLDPRRGFEYIMSAAFFYF